MTIQSSSTLNVIQLSHRGGIGEPKKKQNLFDGSSFQIPVLKISNILLMNRRNGKQTIYFSDQHVLQVDYQSI